MRPIDHASGSGRGRRTAQGLVAAGVAVVTYALVARPWSLRWGATDEEVTRRLPGDDLASDSTIGSTRAVMIAAPAEDVWPWLVQIGYGRGGFYSYDWLENAFVGLVLRGTPGYRSAETILPEHQHLNAGDFIPAGPPDMLGGRLVDDARWKVLAVEPNRALVLEGWGAFVLEPLGDQRHATDRPKPRHRRLGSPRALPLLGAGALRHGAPHAPRHQGAGGAPGPRPAAGGAAEMTASGTRCASDSRAWRAVRGAG